MVDRQYLSKMSPVFSLLVGTYASLLFVFSTVAQATDTDVHLMVTPRGSINRAAGENIFLKCSVEPEAARGAVGNIRWYDPKNDIVMPSAPTNSRAFSQAGSDQSLSLYIMNLKKDDAGEYRCQADFPGHDPLIKTTNIDIYEDVKFVNAPASQTPIAGGPGKILCEVTGNPAPQVDWIRDNQPISTGGRYKIEQDGLVIDNVMEEDEGDYICRASVDSTGGLRSQTINVVVHTKPEIEHGGRPTDTRRVEGDVASMSCVVTGRPAPTITWVFLPTGEDVTKMVDEQKRNRHSVDPVTGALTVNDLMKRDQGDYKCMATNPAGTVDATAQLFVVEKPRFDIVSNTTEAFGRSTSITCTVRGDPAPELQYIKEGSDSPIPEDNNGKYIITKRERELTLTINQLTREDDGLYTCIATNEAGTAEKASHVTVKFKPTFEHTPMHQAKTWLENPLPVNLSCIAEAIPNATVRWEKKQQNTLTGAPFLMITPEMSHISMSQEGAVSSIVFRPRGLEDFGEYECIAANEIGEARHRINLYLARVPAPIQSVEFASVTATTIQFRIQGADEPDNLETQQYEVYYHEAGGDMSNAMQRVWPVNPNGLYVVSDLKPAHRYVFRFHATNALGISPATRDFERTMPDIGPPRPPGLVHDALNNTGDANSYVLLWQEPDDNGSPIIDYQISYRKEGENQPKMVVAPPRTGGQWSLTGLDAGTRYAVEIIARNAKGISAPLNFTFLTASGKFRFLFACTLAATLIAYRLFRFALSPPAGRPQPPSSQYYQSQQRFWILLVHIRDCRNLCGSSAPTVAAH
ncbi:hypothetical protein RvY_01211-2 [Ramazzottius varieornatus]|uniref:Uncharacterized protein n=1 Tax=Ramazzottius varieornatus TaxID=947166 RepID=A0A1D1UFV7_RAMVA|nr:hypothetical protein RvY_01211-2 [Ramazzottius varieornatus]